MKLAKYFLFLFVFFLSVSSYAQFQYSIDDTKVDKKNRMSLGLKIRLKLRKWFVVDRQKKADEKKEKQMAEAELKQKKGVSEYQKRQGTDSEITSKEKVSKRMKRMKRQSDRINKNKSRDNFFQRLFLKNKQKPTKFRK